MKDSYHHGDLPAALRSASAELIAERGPSGFSLREVARRAGVSHAAPAHHFGTTTGLLTSVATEGYTHLAAAFDNAGEGIIDPVARLTALGKAYVSVALSRPGHFTVMANKDLVDQDDPDFDEASKGCYAQLLSAIEALAATHNPDLDINGAAALTWSSVHGLAQLIPSMPMVRQDGMDPILAAEQFVDRFAHLMINGYAKR